MFLVLQTSRNRGAEQTREHVVPALRAGQKRYDTRPEKCQNFGCGWLTDLSFDDDWFPARAKLYVTHTPAMDGGRDVLISIDPAYPNRWREAPYYDRILQIAAKRGRVVVSVGSQVFTLRRAPAS
jgi:hypothetical protein